MEKTKYTKRDNYETLKKLVAGEMVAIEPAEVERLTEFIDHELEQLDKRKENAKTYAVKKAAAPDQLTDAIKTILVDAMLVDSSMSIPDLLAEMPVDLDASAQKLTYRLNKLVEDGLVKRETVSIKEEGKAARRVNFYTYIGETATAE